MGVDTRAFITKSKGVIREDASIICTCLERFFRIFCTAVEKCNPSTPTPKPPTPTPTPTPNSKSHAVPIAVGCSLAALVIIVGVGYMIRRRGRRSNQAAGYRKL